MNACIYFYLLDKLYICGGNDGEQILSTFEYYDFKTNSWVNLPDMLEKRDELAIALGEDNNIYAVGGFGGKNK